MEEFEKVRREMWLGGSSGILKWGRVEEMNE